MISDMKNGSTNDSDVLVVDGVSFAMMPGVSESLFETSFCMFVSNFGTQSVLESQSSTW